METNPGLLDMENPRPQSQRLGRIGLLLVVVCGPLIFSPSLIGSHLGRYVAATGAIGLCLGLALLLLRVVDRLSR